MSFDLYGSFKKNLKENLKKFKVADNDIAPWCRREKIETSDLKKTVVWDKVCPKCRNFIYGDNEYCICGYSLINEKTIKLWGIIIFTWLFIFGFLFLLLNSFSSINSIIYNKIEKSGSDSSMLYPPKIQVISALRDSKYKNYIQTIYVHPKQQNKLMVLIKPVYWDMISSQEKDSFKKAVTEKWNKIYYNSNPDSKLKPEVRLANFE